jgi:hypothetical protein
MQDFFEKAKALKQRSKRQVRKKSKPLLQDDRFYLSAVDYYPPDRTQRILLKPQSWSRTGAKSSQSSDHEEHVRHLLSRSGFGGAVNEVSQYSGQSLNDTVDLLLTPAPMPAPPGDWVSEPFDINAFRMLTPEEQMDYIETNFERINELRGWWIELMLGSAVNLREKLTLFWHGHFTSDIESATLAQFLYIQNDLLREHALGNFGSFLKAIYKDPAMLLYLDGVSNIAASPNENFARELLELFTMGVGNYSEDDIKEAARAFTGWQIDTYNLTSFFNPMLHDYGQKNVLGRTGNFDGDDIVDIILDQPVTAEFICRKLYTHFISREVDEAFITEMATTFRDSHYELAPLLAFMFKSAHFYSENARASLIKSPIELTVGNGRMLNISSVNLYFILFGSAILDQELLRPPNVAGWPGQRSWISPTTYVLRNLYSEVFTRPYFFIDPNTQEPYVGFDSVEFARSFNIAEVEALAAAMIRHLVRFDVDQETIEGLIPALLGTASPGEWTLDDPLAETRICNFLTEVIRLPEFQLT